MKIYLIRHSKTYGNQLGRYIGTTDEPLCEEGIVLLRQKSWPTDVRQVYTSPLLRCSQTAELIFPGIPTKTIAQLSECSFGTFENKNYMELQDNPDYQKWIDSGGSLPFPGGESQDVFRQRCLDGFCKVIADAFEHTYSPIAVVAHGGTIMSILDRYAVPHKDFYEWQVKNACGFAVELNEKNWNMGGQEVTILSDI